MGLLKKFLQTQVERIVKDETSKWAVNREVPSAKAPDISISKEMVRSILEELIKDNPGKYLIPLVESDRPPTEDDIHRIGTAWLVGNDRYFCTELKATWVNR